MSAAHPQAGGFLTTRWTQVLAARGGTQEAKLALRDLCSACYAPVELFVRRQVGVDDARDLTHEFFARLLEQNNLGSPDPTRGRFRSYLLGAVKHFLADRRDHDHALRRGGGQRPQSLDALTGPLAATGDSQVDASFDRQWALAVVEGSIDTLRQEAQAAGDAERFEILKHWLMPAADVGSEQMAALGLSDGARTVAIHRIRKRFRQVVRTRIAETVASPEDVTDELNHLIEALRVAP